MPTEGNPVPPGAEVQLVRTGDGVVLRSARWAAPPPGRPGSVLLIQGRNESIEKYFETVEDLRRRGFAVCTFDWRGQGGSDRVHNDNLCHVESFADYDRDLDAVVRQVFLPDCPPPHFAMAHSMGALVCLRAASAGWVLFERMVLLTPLLGLSRVAAPPMRSVRTLARIGLFLGMDDRSVSRKPWKRWEALHPEDEPRQAVATAVFRAVPQLRSGAPTLRWLHAAARAMLEAARPEFRARIRIPSLLVIASRDNVVANDAIEHFAAGLRSGAPLILPGARHEVLMEEDPIRDAFWAAFDAFIPGGNDYPLPNLPAKDVENTVV
ncbi:MAG: alpha/beta hydrolase [Bauldia sp.]|nr:alpha/beta hydrolase [Bauldia sp.]MCW5717806.1 alpha/beta hydrolase [Bauldia sp.]